MEWPVPERFGRIAAIDAHAAGEPLRVVTGGLPPIPGETILDKRRWARAHLDELRRTLMWEPRGHADMYGCIVTEPVTPDGDAGVLFMHNEGFSTMCGHGVIGLVTVGIECGLFATSGDRPTVRLDTPAGRVTATAEVAGGIVERVALRNVASFVAVPEFAVEVPGIGQVRGAVAYGGAFYAYVDAETVGLELSPPCAARAIDLGGLIKRAVADAHPLAHPCGDRDLGFLYGTIFVQKGRAPVHSRHVCVFADGELDRSPTGTGVAGRAAILHARGELATGAAITIESILGTGFEVRVLEATEVAGLPAVVPEVSGSAYITGRHEFLVDPRDPLRHGFLLPRA